MNNKEKRTFAAVLRLMDEGYIEDTLSVVEDPDFVQVDGKIGGDTVSYRIYNDGRIFAK